MEDNYHRVAKYIATNENEEKDFYKVISNGLFLPAGRTMSNSGIGTNLTLNNCFVCYQVPDDLDGIFECVKLGAKTHKAGGGIGYDFSLIRPTGSKTSNDAIASGPVSFMEVFDTQTSTILQGNRRGANMGVMNIYHPDIEQFITAKTVEGKFTHFNLSVMVDDDFMHAVQKKEKIYLHYPVYTKKGKILKDESKWTTKIEVDAFNLWEKIMKLAYDNGEPGIFFYDNMNKDNNLYYCENIVASNPCVSGDTVILTKNGYCRIDECVNEPTIIWNGYEWSEVTPKITGKNQKMIKFTFSDGSELKTTYYHKFILKNNSRVEAQNLIVGDKLAKFNYPIIEGTVEDKNAYTKGFYSGDGTYNKEKKASLIYLYGRKKELSHLFPNIGISTQENCQDRTEIILPEIYEKDFVPDNTYSINSRLNWLAGLLDSDGSVNGADGSLAISSINRNFLLDVKFMLSTLGVASCLGVLREAGKRMLPSADRSIYKEYDCKKCYRLSIRASMVKKLLELGLQCHRLQISCNPNRDASRFIQITNIEYLEDIEPLVYCFNEPKNHSGIFNGIMTAQCSEYLAGTVFDDNTQKYGGACNLGSLLLHNFVYKPFTKEAGIDSDKLNETIRIAVRMLDNIIDINKFPDKIYENYQKRFRTIGLGVTGLADMLAMLGIEYGSEEALEMTDVIMDTVAVCAYNASCDLAIEKGAFPAYQDDFLKSGYLKKQDKSWNLVKEKIAKYGIRNARILSVAPTGTMSLTFGNNCSSGIEPIFSLEYERKIKFGGQSDDDIQVVKIQDCAYKKWLEICDKPECIVGKDVFVTALELGVDKHIEMLGAIAKHIDMSVSKTINIPEEYSFEDTKDVYLKCWKLGIKGCTIFRPNPLRQGILISNNAKKKEEKKPNTVLGRGDIVVADDNVIGLKRKLTSGCGSIHVQAFFDPVTGLLQETYVSKGSTGGCLSNMNGLSRMISLAARAGVGLEDIVDQLNSCGACPSYATRNATKHDTSPGACCPMAIGRALLEMSDEFRDWMENNENNEIRIPRVEHEKQKAKINKCP